MRRPLEPESGERPVTDRKTLDCELKENTYGHLKRLRWITEHIEQEDQVLEFGCGTGCMITMPLAVSGYNVKGIDRDAESISLGQRILVQEGLGESILEMTELSHAQAKWDVIIASEVLEHIDDMSLSDVLSGLRHRLKESGRLLITVPNGYGWFELESLLWFRIGLGRLLQMVKLPQIVARIKGAIIGRDAESPFPSTLATDPHVQRFTYGSIHRLLRSQGLEVVSITGSVLVAGPFSNLLLTGIKWAMRMNCDLGSRFPRIASGFYVACRCANRCAVEIGGQAK